MIQDFVNKNIILGVCGGIAAYKSAYLVRELTALGANVRVVMTQSAQAFITPLTFQALSGNAVRSELFDPEAERAMGHIELARWADYIVIAPATANCLAKVAQGIADDLLSTLVLVAEVPLVICPAMNRCMWQHPAVQANCQQLLARGVRLIGPEDGEQACGEIGLGRLSALDNIINALRLIDLPQTLQGQHVLLTAGPTRESIDPVRYVSNHSSGKMGYAMAYAAWMAGARVTLISGPTTLPAPFGVKMIHVNTARDMQLAVQQHLTPETIFIGAAAVADYGITQPAIEKIKKNKQKILTLTFQENPDILAEVAAQGRAAFVVGFAAETTAVIEHARQKLRTKKLNMIIANQVGHGMGFECDDNQVTLLTVDEQVELPQMHKVRLAGLIMTFVAKEHIRH